MPVADMFEDLNEARVDVVPGYLWKDISNTVQRCGSEISALSQILKNTSGGSAYSQSRLIYSILSGFVRDFCRFHPRSSASRVDEKAIRIAANNLNVQISLNLPNSMSTILTNLFEALAKDDCRDALISCWNKAEAESELLWKTYAGKSGVRIKTTWEKLSALVCTKLADETRWDKGKNGAFASANFTLVGGNVKYLSEVALDKKLSANSLVALRKLDLLKETVFYKSDAYRGDEEFRILLFEKDWEYKEKKRGVVDPQVGVEFPLPKNPKDFLDEIMLSPYLSECEEDKNEELFEKLFPGVPIVRSSMRVKK